MVSRKILPAPPRVHRCNLLRKELLSLSKKPTVKQENDEVRIIVSRSKSLELEKDVSSTLIKAKWRTEWLKQRVLLVYLIVLFLFLIVYFCLAFIPNESTQRFWRRAMEVSRLSVGGILILLGYITGCIAIVKYIS
eukprot:GILJ01011591.1.p1 GENE.GILJ01011591.1~~GILJ01011591.1.p1  ORF type:complete len:136 (-),score=19.68 GILJ01011591.1:774-1181(-)